MPLHPLVLLSWLDFAAFGYMLIVWYSYSRYAKHRAKQGNKQSLSHSMRLHRERWVSQMLDREMRVTDSALLASQERVVGFFASTTLLLLAAVFTAISASGQIAMLSLELPFATAQSNTQVQTKFMLIAVMLIYAFFQITWSLRQYGFVAVLMGAAPMPNDEMDAESRSKFIQQTARLMDMAGHDNNAGLRAYYFCLSMIFWLLNPLLYMAAATLIVAVLAQREFKSKTVRTLEGTL
jgi:uncharacterized membrane protein